MMWTLWHTGNPKERIPAYKDVVKGPDLVKQSGGTALLSKIRNIMCQLPSRDATKTEAENKAAFQEALASKLQLWTGKCAADNVVHFSMLSCSRVYDIFSAYSKRNANANAEAPEPDGADPAPAPAPATAPPRAAALRSSAPKRTSTAAAGSSSGAPKRARVDPMQPRLDGAFRTLASQQAPQTEQSSAPPLSSNSGSQLNATPTPLHEPWIIDNSDGPDTVTDSRSGLEVHTLKSNRNTLSKFLHDGKFEPSENNVHSVNKVLECPRTRLRMIPARADGNCLFHSVLQVLPSSKKKDNSGRPWNATSLRQAVFAHMETELSQNAAVLEAVKFELGDVVVGNDATLMREYCTKYSQDGTYCGQPELLAISSLLKCRINLCQLTKGSMNLLLCACCSHVIHSFCWLAERQSFVVSVVDVESIRQSSELCPTYWLAFSKGASEICDHFDSVQISAKFSSAANK